GVVILVAFELGARSVDPVAGPLDPPRFAISDAGRSVIDIQTDRIERLEFANELSSKYGIGADLATAIHEIALAQGVDPPLAFELVRVESGFNPRAVSPAGALGLTQLMPGTAQVLSPGISRAEILDRNTNLQLGFRFFRSLLDRYGRDVRLALLAYNRGPVTVDQLLAAGIDPSNGYAETVMRRIQASSD
ncbi:MAG: transglycosylase SLT domain-containing protein, partial [Gemmatimonas sp.]|nr:transglycosylase SLT domain-containing protein [Gemmatimonas sp.]